ncbi:hypothetical protein [Sphaerisporangium siamense]|uniref:Uncharacterized protein (TIGR02646 family) n=1 Tax=Sphaerisporangium siamense TaxID=795645 RepID=A0A7W7G8S9_9ACTN|nr:hypothetical protein [Sphaerisporangium siamense]MBB4700642.1 uncharacterized protein (TIGR02646 family) [Sphaerisporangium siamense]
MDVVRAAMAENKERIFKAHWTDDEVRDPLLALIGQKCWYCETIIQRADVNVDHFRPKSEVLDEPGHLGYWWLAYEIENYRITCKHCNSGGARFDGVPEGRAKGSRFPLLAGPRAWQPGNERLEQPLLLDPAQQGDPDLLGFDSYGYARRSNAPYSPAEAQSGVCRADETIRILALNATQITEQRRELMTEIAELAQISSLPTVQARIERKVHPTAPWSSAATAALALQRACALPTDPAAQPETALSATTVFDRHRSNVDLRNLLEHLDPAELAAGIPLTIHYKKDVRAVLQRDGRINVLGRTWGTPTSAARVAIGSDDVDGWDFWRLTTAGVEQSLADFRAKHTP